MNLEIINLIDKEINDLKKFFKKIDYPTEKISKEFNIKEVSSQISEKYEKTISPGQVEAVMRRVMKKTPLSTKQRSQLYDLRKKIKRYEKFLTYFGEWGKEPNNLFKVIIIGLNEDQSRKFHSLLITPKNSGERITIGVDFHTKTIESYDKSLTKLQFWNVSGNKRFESLREHYYKGAHAMIIVYEKGNQESLNSAKMYYSEFKKTTNLKFKLLKLRNVLIETSIILVANI
jgi:GTPase SAR1 family protein